MNLSQLHRSMGRVAVLLVAAAIVFGSIGTASAAPTLYHGNISLLTGIFPVPFTGQPVAAHSAGDPGYLQATPAGFTVRPDEFTLATGPNTNPSPPPGFAFSTTTFMAANGAGDLSAAGGPGAFTFCPGGCALPTRPGQLAYSGGAGYGGTMQVLGVVNFKIGLTGIGAGLFAGTLPINISPIGGPAGGTATNMATFTHTTLGLSSPVTEVVTGFPWTTGQVNMTMMAGAVSSTLTTTGAKTLNAPGTAGNIQLVAGMLTHFSGFVPDEVVTQASATMTFVPEPASTLALAVGVLAMAGSARTRRSCRG